MSFTFSRVKASGSRRRPHFEAAQLQSGRGQEGRVDPRFPAKIPQTRWSGPFGEFHNILIQILYTQNDCKFICFCLFSLAVRLRQPSIFPVAGPECPKSLRVFRQWRETRPLLRQEPNVGMKSVSSSCILYSHYCIIVPDLFRWFILHTYSLRI